MSESAELMQDLVKANHILAHEGILDALGHISVRDPDDAARFVMSRTRSPQLVELSDLVRMHLDGSYVDPDGPKSYSERFIHAAVYEANPAVMAVCHSHAAELLPFTVSTTVRLQAVIHNARFIGTGVDVWDIADEFGENTDLLVKTQEQGRSLVKTLGSSTMVLMRGHGSVIVGNELRRVVDNCVYAAKNARVLTMAALMGSYKPLYAGECAEAQRSILSLDRRDASFHDRPWEYYTHRSGDA